ncbi:MAG: hypothetical protein FWE40_09085 [Oscillospiraceae bacterium]|jgi:hypothetical protein|nr:hypothetical protein [Oscillospiraceae bacterium]
MSHKKTRALFHAKNYEPCCALCLHGKPAPDLGSILCPHRGVMLPDSLCKKYEYDPIKRRPERAPTLPEFEPEQFTL